VIGYAAAIETAATSTWSGLTADFNTVVQNTLYHTGAHATFGGAGAQSVSNQWTGTFTQGAAIFASFNPA
jgi:hypothetical protein